jgi:hypothetical protein
MAAMVGNSNAAGYQAHRQGNSYTLGRTTQPQVPSPDGSPCIREQCQKELASSWHPNQNGPGYACVSCYSHYGAGRRVKEAADPRQTAITQFFKKQQQ